MDIANQVKTRREAAGLSQEELARRVYVSRQTVSNWECDRTYPDVQSLLLLSELFGTSLDTLVKGDVDVMDEVIARDRELRWKITLLTYLIAAALVVIACAVLFTPTLDVLGDSLGVMPAALLVIAVTSCLVAALVFLAVKEQRILKKHDIVTYRQLRAFQRGEDFKGGRGFGAQHPGLPCADQSEASCRRACDSRSSGFHSGASDGDARHLLTACVHLVFQGAPVP